jgi:hypothetical protein
MGGADAFDASNRVNERAFIEWLLIHLYERTDYFPLVDGTEVPGRKTEVDFPEVFNSPEATVRRALVGTAINFQLSRILWGDAWAMRIAKEADELMDLYSRGCLTIYAHIVELEEKLGLPLGLNQLYPPKMELSRSPFEILGLSSYAYWIESDKCFPRGPRFCHEPDCSWEDPIDLDSDPMWLHSRTVPACIVPDDEYQKAVSDYKERGHLLWK